ncbi:hypothetical protein DICPUDRAFT_83255 [Dictyostelium purpureum]|uniref:Uncharacterized protein n=1 Tax=Dictyostelium purpureum TaxID=5786 RepID=F0ZZ06_DICPU|nr:uncharacterized protein DICPUDRAFT_83255 [Dictyostelium purpureum]EGC30836.1 hypothetical protein DICPUDRAFT_83255 [Dictyostelium purpureum]|eukprot:XP_003292650.1 hypothetical protein DICPUDRAFT_83255 [Dictyostelium purpureum]
MNNSSNNNNNNNNNNHDQKTSELFYLVFHNKYLFNKIFHFINSVELFKYNNINDIPDNRIFFKNITSVHFLLYKNLYYLLKSKLESDEYIHVNCSYRITDMIGYDIDLSKEIFKLQSQSTSISCEDNDSLLFDTRQLRYFSEDFIQIAVNEPFSFPIFRSTLSYFFSYSTNSKIQIILDSFYNINNKSNNKIQTTFTNEYKNEIIKDIYDCGDLFQRDRVLQLVLSNKEYYNIHINNKINIIDILFKTISIENQNQLLDMKLYFFPDYINQNDQNEMDDIINKNKDINRIIKLSGYIRKHVQKDYVKSFQFNYFSNGESIQLENLKLVLQNNTNNWKKIKNYSRQLSFNTDTIKFYFENKKHLYFMESDIWETIGVMFDKYLCKLDKKKFCQLIESIPPCRYKIYSLWKEVVKRTKTTIPTELITDSIEYNDSSNNNYKKNNKSPETTTTLLVVKDKQTLDLISNILDIYKQTIGYFPEFSTLDIMGCYWIDLPEIDENTFKFNSVELIKYTHKKIFKLNLNIFKQTPIRSKKAINDTVLEIPLKNAMETFNLKELKSIFELTKDYSLSRLYYSYKKPNRPLSYQDITQLTEVIEYFININCPQGVYYCLDLMPEGNYEHTEKDNYLTNLSNSCEVLTIVFAISTKLLSVHVIKLLINKYLYNADVENKLPNYISSYILNVENLKTNRNRPIPLSFYSNRYYAIDFQTQRYDNINIDDLISIIHLIINKSKQLQNQTQQPISNINYENFIFTPTPKVHIFQGEALKFVINILFKILIQSKGEVPFEKIKSTYQFINNSGVTTVQKSTLFSIYYLANKSLTLIKYLLGLPIFSDAKDGVSYNWDGTIFYRQDRKKQGKIVLNLNDYIDPEVFSFEYIFGNNNCINCDNGAPCIDIIENLHQNIFNKSYTIFKESPPINMITDLYIQTIKTLFFFQRYDLFLKYLEELKLKYNSYDEQSNRFIKISNIIQTGDHTLISTVLNEYSNYCILSTSETCNLLKYNVENNTNIGQSLIKNKIIINNKSFDPDTVLALHHLIFDEKSQFKFSFNIKPYQMPFKLYQLLLNTYPNNTLLKLSKTIINETINRKKIHFLKQLYQNNLVNDDIDNINDEYNQLLSHLKQKLSEHKEYKYINWFN